jgi:hypothetical protein
MGSEVVIALMRRLIAIAENGRCIMNTGGQMKTKVESKRHMKTRVGFMFKKVIIGKWSRYAIFLYHLVSDAT